MVALDYFFCSVERIVSTKSACWFKIHTRPQTYAIVIHLPLWLRKYDFWFPFGSQNLKSKSELEKVSGLIITFIHDSYLWQFIFYTSAILKQYFFFSLESIYIYVQILTLSNQSRPLKNPAFGFSFLLGWLIHYFYKSKFTVSVLSLIKSKTTKICW